MFLGLKIPSWRTGPEKISTAFHSLRYGGGVKRRHLRSFVQAFEIFSGPVLQLGFFKPRNISLGYFFRWVFHFSLWSCSVLPNQKFPLSFAHYNFSFQKTLFFATPIKIENRPLITGISLTLSYPSHIPYLYFRPLSPTYPSSLPWPGPKYIFHQNLPASSPIPPTTSSFQFKA